MNKLRVAEVIVVEGRYDAAALSSLVDGLILTTGGFSVFADEEQKELLRTLGKKRGLLILTDSDSAGFRIRHYLQKIAGGCVIKHAYIPAVPGKEKRKTLFSKEGTLGVEGMPPALLREALLAAGAGEVPARSGRAITYTDLYEWGLSGGEGSATARRTLLARIGLPPRLSKKALCEVANSLYTYEEFRALLQQKPALFWDFHGTLTHADLAWFDAAIEAAAQHAPEAALTCEILQRHFSKTCLPWWEIPSGDTRHLTDPADWWAFCIRNFTAMLQRCGLSLAEAEKVAPAMHGSVLQPKWYTLYDDAIPTLMALQKRGYENYILSNNFPELEQLVQALGLTPYIKKVFSSALIGYEKPRPEIYAHALAAANNPAAAWMIGDSAAADIEGGNNAGFATVAVGGLRHPQADYTLGQLADILTLLP